MPSNIHDLCDPLSAEDHPTPGGSLASLESLTMAASAIFEKGQTGGDGLQQQKWSRPSQTTCQNGPPTAPLPSIAQILPEHFPQRRRIVLLPFPQPNSLHRPPPYNYVPVNLNLQHHSRNCPATHVTSANMARNHPQTQPPGQMFSTFKLDKHQQPAKRRPSDSKQPPLSKRAKGDSNSPAEGSGGLDATVQACIAEAKARCAETIRDDSVTTRQDAAEALKPADPVQQISFNFRNFSLTLGPKATNLTSNQYGTATADKTHYAAVMTDSLLCTSLNLLEAFTDEYKPTVNNKLKALKFMEFLQERFQLHFCGSRSIDDRLAGEAAVGEDVVVAYRMPESLLGQYGHRGSFHVLRQGSGVGVAIYRGSQRLYSSCPSAGRFVSPRLESLAMAMGADRSHDVLKGVERGDCVVIYRGGGVRVADVLAGELAGRPVGSDLDASVDRLNASLNSKSAVIVLTAVLGDTFDELYAQPHQLRHIVHTERKGHLAIDQPWPYAITKHSFLLRPYLAMIYADASKINRFSPTIEFIVRKAMAGEASGRCLTERLEKLSEIQHMAGVVLVAGDQLRFWGTGGAFLILVDRRDARSGCWPVSFPGLQYCSPSQWRSNAPLPVGQVEYHVGDLVFLLCPAVRRYWNRDELAELLGRPNKTISEKLSTIVSRFTDERAFRSGVGAFEIV